MMMGENFGISNEWMMIKIKVKEYLMRDKGREKIRIKLKLRLVRQIKL